MAIYRIAELNIKINPKSDYLEKLLSDYLIKSDIYDFEVNINESEIQHEAEIAQTQAQEQSNQYISEAMCESVAVFRKICKEILLNYNGFMLHSAAIRYNGKAYLFTAPSGTGKTTHIKLWKKYLKDKVQIINGDKPLLRYLNREINVYGTPWQGKENYGSNIKAPLGGIFLLERSIKNSVKKTPTKNIIPFLLTQTLRYQSQEQIENLFSIIEKIVINIPVYTLKCNMNISAVKTAMSVIENSH
ncbi:MAG: hypothetical protein UH239_01940 [Acutalibacteraceae bacterium]|nr:hypothetical protein [Acutalibacteraceae bacterium]